MPNKAGFRQAVRTRLATVAIAMCLAGCFPTTMKGLRSREPILDADSSKSTVAIGSCLVEAAGKTGQASYVPNPNGATVTVQLANKAVETPLFAAKIADTGTSRHVTVWMLKTIWSKHNRHIVEDSRACL